MIKKILISLLIAVSLGRVRADEGMWLLPLLEQLNINTMKAMGCGLSVDEIYSINHSSLKDAVVIFGGGCTGAMVSGEGLLLTNHHCGYDAIQQHSSLGHNYLDEGFWAKTHAEELYTPNLKVTFLVRIEDVTARIDSVLTDGLTEAQRNDSIRTKSAKIEDEAMLGNRYTASVDSYFGGNKFYLLVYEEYTDVRMVGAPPSSIGKFGADTDNWMWPRHTGDFSVFRVYADSLGRPARYSDANVPLKPKQFLPVSLKGVKKSDFTMVLGYPGSTERYATAKEIESEMNFELPARVKIRGEKQEIMMYHMEADPAVRIKYASKYSRSSNYWKNAIGMMKGVKRLNVVDRKKKQEADFMKWLKKNPEQQAKYGNALALVDSSVTKGQGYRTAIQYVSECFLQGTELLRFALQFRMLANRLQDDNPDQARVSFVANLLKKSAREFYKDYDMELDRDVTEAMLRRYAIDMEPEYYPEFYRDITRKYKGNIHKYAQERWFKSMFADSVKLFAFLQKPSMKKLMKDPVYQAANNTRNLYNWWASRLEDGDLEKTRGKRLYIAGLQAMTPDKAWYPDANFTMRLSYGAVKDYFPMDAVYYSYYTTLKGVMEKEDPDNWEFVVPQRLKDLYASRNYGQYANELGELPLCFISNNDITGGNSGSPVINGHGELVGLAFDGNWEAMSGDIAFEPSLQRTISVDIRYVLFIIDKFAGAGHLLNEMTLVR